MRPVVVKYTKLCRGCELLAHLHWEEGVGFAPGSGGLFPGLFANLLSQPPSAAQLRLRLEDSWGTEAGAKWRLSWLLRAALQQAQCCVLLPVVCVQTWRMGMNEERVYGYWTSTIRKSSLPCNPPGGLGRRMFLSQPPEDPAFTPQLDDA